MIVLEPKRIEVFEQIAVEKFIDEMLIHCKKFSPRLCKALDDERLRQVIDYGVKKAELYGFTDKGPVRLFLEMILLFGSEFDTDPQYVWVQDTLKEETILQSQRADDLFTRALNYLDKVNGPEDVFLIQAIDEMVYTIERTSFCSSSEFLPTMLRETRRIYPEKFSYVGGEALQLLFQKSESEANAYGLKTVSQRVIVGLLAFEFGHGFSNDNLYPWIGGFLKGETKLESANLEGQLKQEVLEWLDIVYDWRKSELGARS